MNKEKGITLVALTLYVVMFTAVLVFLANLSNYIYGNLGNINTDSTSLTEFNRFNIKFIKDIKEHENGYVNDLEDGNYLITLTNATNSDEITYSYIKSEYSIYRNSEKVAQNIYAFEPNFLTINNKNVLRIRIATGKNNIGFDKTFNYVLKYW